MGDYLKILEEDRRRSIRRVQALAEELELVLSSEEEPKTSLIAPVSAGIASNDYSHGSVGVLNINTPRTEVRAARSYEQTENSLSGLCHNQATSADEQSENHARAVAAFLRRTGSASMSPPRQSSSQQQQQHGALLIESAAQAEATKRYEGRAQDIIVVSTDSPTPGEVQSTGRQVAMPLSSSSAPGSSQRGWKQQQSESCLSSDWNPIAPWSSPGGGNSKGKQPLPTRTFHPDSPTSVGMFGNAASSSSVLAIANGQAVTKSAHAIPQLMQVSSALEFTPSGDDGQVLSPRAEKIGEAAIGRKKSVSFAPVSPDS